MYLVDDYGEPYVALFSVQYTPKYSDYPCRPHDACFKLKRDPKGREGVFIQPFSRDGISPVAHVSHEVEAALALGWPELSPNGYVVKFPGHYDGAKEIGSFSAGHESLMELPILMGILESMGSWRTPSVTRFTARSWSTRRPGRLGSRFLKISISSSDIGSGITGRTLSHPRKCRRFPLPATRTRFPTRPLQFFRKRRQSAL